MPILTFYLTYLKFKEIWTLLAFSTFKVDFNTKKRGPKGHSGDDAVHKRPHKIENRLLAESAENLVIGLSY